MTQKRNRQLARQRSFLAAYRLSGSVKRAAEAAKVHRKSHDEWLRDDPTYRPRFEACCDSAAQVLEDEAVRRAVEGEKRQQFYQGKPLRYKGNLVHETEYSDTLMLALLKRFRPDLYRERTSVEHTGSIDIVERLKAGRERLLEMKRDDSAAS